MIKLPTFLPFRTWSTHVLFVFYFINISPFFKESLFWINNKFLENGRINSWILATSTQFHGHTALMLLQNSALSPLHVPG